MPTRKLELWLCDFYLSLACSLFMLQELKSLLSPRLDKVILKLMGVVGFFAVPLVVYGIQHYFSIVGSLILIPLVIVPAAGGQDVSLELTDLLTYSCTQSLAWLLSTLLVHFVKSKDLFQDIMLPRLKLGSRSSLSSAELQHAHWMSSTCRRMSRKSSQPC